MKYIILTMIVLFILSGMSVYGQAVNQKADEQAKVLFETKCSTCHKVDKATSQKKSATDWNKTVMRMKNVRGAAVTDEEARTIIDYLAKFYGKN